MSKQRTELQREVVEALVSSKAVNFDAIGSVLAKFGARAALSGDGLGAVIHRRVMDICIPPFERVLVSEIDQISSKIIEE